MSKKKEQEAPEKEIPEEETSEQPAAESGQEDEMGAELQKMTEELQKQKEILMRTVAEYDNFRKRTEREKRAIYTDATADAVKEILPIADSLEFAVKAQDGATEEYQKGLEMVQKQFLNALEKLGVAAVGAPGEEFDPLLHNAIAHIDDETVADNTIVEVFQKGYKLGDKVIRPAMVKVAN